MQEQGLTNIEASKTHWGAVADNKESSHRDVKNRRGFNLQIIINKLSVEE